MTRLFDIRVLILTMALGLLTCSKDADPGVTMDAAMDAAAGDGGLPVLTISRVDEFFCDPGAVVGTQAILDVNGDPGGEIVLRATAAPCQFDLLYTKAGAVTQLSTRPGGYLIVNAGTTADGTIVVCASTIVHAPTGDGTNRISGVPLECTIKPAGGAFGPLTALVDGAGDYAAWVDEIGVSADAPGILEVLWYRDFSLQFMNLGTAGRPLTDGLYRTRFTLGPGGTTIPSTTTRESVDPLAPERDEHEGWTPTPEELQLYSPWITADQGPCPPPGCKMP